MYTLAMTIDQNGLTFNFDLDLSQVNGVKFVTVVERLCQFSRVGLVIIEKTQ